MRCYNFSTNGEAMNFTEAKNEFDRKYGNKSTFLCFLPDHLTKGKTTTLLKANGSKNEQYYKWQFLYSVVTSGMYAKDFIGTEVHFPKGNVSSAHIKIDAAIFDDGSWFEKYVEFHEAGSLEALDWLRDHLLFVIEFKKEDNKNIAEVWDKQLKAYMRESNRAFVLGALYDTEKLYLFYRQSNKYLRLCESLNQKGMDSKTKDLSLHLPDPYSYIPNYESACTWVKSAGIDRSEREITDLETISGVHSSQINDAMSAILRTMDQVGLVNQTGFQILIQILALKIFDEKRNEKVKTKKLHFYIKDEEANFASLADVPLQEFIDRIAKLREDASEVYYRILDENVLNTRNENHVKVLIEVVKQFQDYSFVRSHKTDLYQLVFYKFAAPFSKDQNAQFITPLPLIDFLVRIVNPRNGETVTDPTLGIADFLSVSYVNSNSKLDDNNIFGIDIDQDMVRLATLNMLLNGDGNAKIKAQAGYGSILSKFDTEGDLIDLVPAMNKDGNWDIRPDSKKIKKFDVVLTNPPFGDDRAFVPKTEKDKEVIQCYELWKKYGSGSRSAKKIDKGIIFLENAYRILKEGGRLGIVLSNSIASIDAHRVARQWLMEKMRVVAIFDLPANVFAETGVNTSIIVAYKPSPQKLRKLQKDNYVIFSRDIRKVGYEVKTVKRVKVFSPVYKINCSTFEIAIDADGNPMLDEDFTNTISEFKSWCLTQEAELQDLFVKAK